MIRFHFHPTYVDRCVAIKTDMEHTHGRWGANFDNIHTVDKFAGKGEHLCSVGFTAQVMWRLQQTREGANR